MITAISFWIVFISVGLLVALIGDGQARRFMSAVTGATFFTMAIDLSGNRFFAPALYLLVDASLFAAACYFVWSTPKFWPIWFAAFQLITVASEIGRLLLPGILPIMYTQLAGFLGMPALVAMAIGLFLDWQAMPPQHRARN